ncbi:hypothetical protein BLNAU_16957 [Blattamonas nauphoetae]|uniref:Uncharacterized protein n=1 Tax=Blattamonas nauphoetae TaxID=2049346 RepID=A0ABQ9XB37_9EUKA|nr:hypothetical protein BLNAU_16957 [Blattamonas nauphoetae]
MTEIAIKPATSSNPTRSDLTSSQLFFSIDCSPFLNWNKEDLESPEEWAIVFRSLVATVKSQPALDVCLEAKAVKLLVYISPWKEESADAFLNSFASNSGDSTTEFVQYIVVLLSSTSQVITTAAMKLLDSVVQNSSAQVRLTLVKADLVPQLINTLNPQSFSFAEGVDIHINLTNSVSRSLWLATPYCLEQHGIEDWNEQQAVHETVLKHVVAPSEKYIRHLCVNRYSIIGNSRDVGNQQD